MTKSFRVDQEQGELRPPREDARGFWIVEGYVGRAGIYEYVNNEKDVKEGHLPLGGVRRELRPEEEVFRADALAGFESAPVTALHPKNGTIPVTVDNARTYSVGFSTAPGRREGSRVAASMTITDPKTIAKVKSRELDRLSPGYKARIIKEAGADRRYATPSNPEGRYDCIQRDIQINHLALVPRARGGDDLRLRLDAMDDGLDIAVERNPDSADSLPRNHVDTTGGHMDPAEQIASLKVQLTEAEKTASLRKSELDQAVARADAADARTKTMEERLTALESQLAAGATALETEAIREHATRADSAEQALADLKASREEEIRKAAEVRVKAITVMGPEFRVDGMNERSIQVTVIKKFAPKEDTSEKVSAAYIAQRFDSLVDAHHKTARSHARISEIAAPVIGAGRRETRADSLDTREGRAKAWHEQALNGGYQAGDRQKEA